MTSLKWFFSLCLTLNLASCAFDKNANTDNRRELEDTATLLHKFSQVTGLYRGTITTSSGLQQVELSFYPYYRKVGQNTNGEDKYKPELRARYRRLDTVVDDVILSVRFYEETSQVLMSNAEEGGGLTLNAQTKLNAGALTGTISQNSVPLGHLEARLITREYATPNPNDQEEKNIRLRELYDSISGVYSGVVRPSPKEGAPFGITLELYHVDQMIGGVTKTVLKAYYNRTSDPERTRELNLDVDYKPDTNPPSISMVSTTGGKYSITINGTLAQGVLQGVFKDQRALGGPVTLRKK